ncbi:hypothetical protein DXI23_04725 [Marinobacter flavimaris]|uniref:DUF1190 domain-containing protein n=2 Tax=Marinobacteraceae TaxID=2887365 RepID=A0A3D8H5B6_9GAMM|nr:hypothetical protein MDHKLMBL_03625 [Marinobacter flavimaris]RDU41631.1 hypothetical protein DXI23_04725 [Marinobacter flavimaris]
MVREIRMSVKNRPIICVLLSLLLVISAPAFALSKATAGQAKPAMADCGSMMMMDRAEDAAYSTDAEPDCVSSPEMACLSATGPIKCGVSVSLALLPENSIGFKDTGSQAVLAARAALYQDPFLASITPPPEHHS